MGRVLLAFLLSGLLAFPAWGQTDKEIKSWYNDYNTGYFQGKLPQDVIIQHTTTTEYYARTFKTGGKFVISFSDSYVLGELLTELILQHEMCHIEAWDELVRTGIEHGPKWRVCMYKLKAQGASDSLIIEAY